MQIMFLEKNTIMISEVNMRRPQVIPQKKKISNNFFLQCSLPMSVSKTTIKKI